MAEPEPRDSANLSPTSRPVRPLDAPSSLRERISASQPSHESTSSTLPGVGAASTTGNGGELNCQWCAVQLAQGVTICPTCGSPGLPDAALSVPGGDRLRDEPFEVRQKAPEELIEWWRDEAEESSRSASGGSVYRNSGVAQETDPLVTVAALGGAVVVCVALGILAAPLLAPLMESITGVEVENVNDLRPMGGIIGLLTGLFVGAILSWVVQPRG